MVPPGVVLVPRVPTTVEVDPETAIPAVPFRLVAVFPSLLGLPLRLGDAVPVDEVCVPAAPLIVAFERIQPPAFAVVRAAEAVRDALVPCVKQPVTVTRCGLFAAGRFFDVLVPVCADATASDSTAAAHACAAIHLCICSLPRNN